MRETSIISPFNWISIPINVAAAVLKRLGHAAAAEATGSYGHAFSFGYLIGTAIDEYWLTEDGVSWGEQLADDFEYNPRAPDHLQRPPLPTHFGRHIGTP